MKVRYWLLRTLSVFIYTFVGIIHVIASIRHLILRIVVFVVLFIPTIFYVIKQELGFDNPIALYRREYIALFSLDVAISQHFFILSGYSVGAVCIAYLGTLFGSFSTLEALQPWVTIATVDGGSTAALISIFLGVYGAVGVGIVASLIISTYSRVLDQIPRSDSDQVRYLAGNLKKSGIIEPEDVNIGEIEIKLDVEIDLNEIDDNTSLQDVLDRFDLDFADDIGKDTIADQLNKEEFDEDMWETLAERKLDRQDESETTDYIRNTIGENLSELVESGHLASPTYEKFWRSIRVKDPWAQDHPILLLSSEQKLNIKNTE